MLKTIFRTFLLGLGVGVLVAPRPGHETRQLLSEKFNQLFNTSDANTSAQEWERPLSDNVDTAVTPSHHYTDTSIGSSSVAIGDTSGTVASGGSTAGATDI